MTNDVDPNVLRMYATEDFLAALENGDLHPEPEPADLENWLERRPSDAEWKAYVKAFNEEKRSAL